MTPNVAGRGQLPAPADASRIRVFGGSKPHASRVHGSWGSAAGRPRAARPRVAVTVNVAAPQKQDVTSKIVSDEGQFVLQTYGRPKDLVFTHGKGSKLYTADGREFLDFAAGIAVNSIGHSHPHWVAAVQKQAADLVHVSNLFHSEPQTILAKRLVESSFADRVFFCNSGTEANEGAIKFARKWARVNAGLDPFDKEAGGPSELISFHNCFHGRTMGALALTYKQQYKTPFLPLIGGAKMATYMDLESAAAVIEKGKTAAVFIEPIQGEGGINVPTAEFLQGLRKLCDDAGALLVYDEVQCGLGRTGKLFGYQNFGVEPDIMTLAKPLAGGLPIGAVLMKQHVADAIAPGDHGSTFAGAPLVCTAANACLDIIQEPGFLESVTAKGERLRSKLSKALSGNPHVKDVRGAGLICGVELDVPAAPVTAACLANGVIVITAGAGNIIRMVPPLVITDDDIDKCVTVLSAAVAAL